MPREVAKTTTKSKMELSATKYNRHSLNFVAESSSPPPFPPRLHGSPRYPQMFLKNMLKLL